MNHIFEGLEEIKSTQGTLAKSSVLKKCLRDKEFENFIRKFYDDTVYGVSKKTLVKPVSKELQSESYDDVGELWGCDRQHVNNIIVTITPLTFDSFSKMLENVKTKTGKELDRYISDLYFCLPQTERKWFARFILGDLRIGIDLKTINIALESMDKPKIEKFGVQLCGKSTVYEWTEFPCFASVKYDGFRCYVTKRDTKVTMLSRQGKDVSTFLPELKKEFLKIPADFDLDGEVMAESFSDIQHRIGKKGEMNVVPDLHYRAFDILFIEYYSNPDDSSHLERAQECARWCDLQRFVSEYYYGTLMTQGALEVLQDNDKLLRLEKRFEIDASERLKDFYTQCCNNKEEGIIIKKYDAEYERNGRKSWFKVKPTLENTFVITAVHFGTGKNKDKISTVTVTDATNDIVSDVGSGFSDVDRDWMTQKSEELIGTFVDIEYNEISKNQSGQFSLRFPRFLKFRHDKTTADTLEKE